MKFADGIRWFRGEHFSRFTAFEEIVAATATLGGENYYDLRSRSNVIISTAIDTGV